MPKALSETTYLLWQYTAKDVRIMARNKVTVSLSSKCLQLIDNYAETTGFESRSRVVEEAIFAISELIGYRALLIQPIQEPKRGYSQEEIMNSFLNLMNLLSKFGGILDRFVRFENIAQKQASEKIYRKVPVQEREKRE